MHSTSVRWRAWGMGSASRQRRRDTVVSGGVDGREIMHGKKLLLLGAALALAYAGVALWTLVCIFIVMARIASALAVKLRGGAIRPWHEEQTA